MYAFRAFSKGGGSGACDTQVAHARGRLMWPSDVAASVPTMANTPGMTYAGFLHTCADVQCTDRGMHIIVCPGQRLLAMTDERH